MCYMQKVVNDLEAYKRRLGVKFDKTPKSNHQQRCYLWCRYNEVENNIRHMVAHTNAVRKSQPYKLPLEALK